MIENLATNTPLNHGSVTGTFTANLPISGTVNISTFSFNVYDSSNNLLDSFSNTSANATGIASVFSSNSNCCDTFNFGIDGVVSLELYAPLNFTGGDLIVSLNTVHHGDNVNVGTSVFLADSAGNDVAGITSGTVGSPVPEPATWALLATGLLAGLWLERKRLFA